MAKGNTQTDKIRSRLAFWEATLEKLQEAYLALVDGGAQSYQLPDRSLTRLSLPELFKEIKEAEQKVEGLSKLLNGQKPRKAFAVLPRDW